MKMSGILVAIQIDFEKAFDSLDHTYLLKALMHSNNLYQAVLSTIQGIQIGNSIPANFF